MRLFNLATLAAISLFACLGCGGTQDGIPPENPQNGSRSTVGDGPGATDDAQAADQDGNNDTDQTSDAQTPPTGDDAAAPPENTLTEEQKREAGVKAMELYRQAQTLMGEEKYEEGYAAAQQAMTNFTDAENDLPWMMLETIEREKSHVQVLFNMGEDERNPPADGIIRPLSFRISSSPDVDGPMEVIDFEIARRNGEDSTAALGATTPDGHANMGMMPLNSSYESIRAAVIDLLEKSGR